jgi:hypothetical protein
MGGDRAREWALEYQVVEPLDDRPVFDGRGMMLLVRQGEADENWKVEGEMLNQGTKP